MVTSTPAKTDVSARMETSGVMGWNPTVADLTVAQGATGDQTDQAAKTHVIWVDDVLYTDKGKFKEVAGKEWGKLDMAALGKRAGDAEGVRRALADMAGMGEDPARQLALLLNAPSIEHVGSEDVGGGRAEHYKGSFTAESVIKSTKKVAALTPRERGRLLVDVERAGVDSYDFDVWVSGADYPVKMNTWMKSPKGVITTSADFSDYGTKVAVEAPPAGDTVDMSEMLKELRERELGLR